MNRISGRAWIVMLVVFALVGGMIFFVGEFSANARQWVFHDGSPHVYDGMKPQNGVILDRENKLLLDLSGNWAYSISADLRQATLHWVGDRLGNVNAPILSRYTYEMTGYDLLNGLYRYGNLPGYMELTLSAKAQTAALEAMGDYKGTLAVYNYKTGQLICAVTTPTFDPDAVPDISGDTEGRYDGVYLNRFTQAVFTPGSIFKLVTAAAALETIPDILDREFVCTGELEIGGGMVTCEAAHWDLDFESALVNSCNCTFAQIAQEIGSARLQRYAESFGITESICFDGINTARGNLEAKDALPYDLAWAGIGQHTDLINPCQFLSFVGAIANGGNGAMPYVVERITVGGSATYTAQTRDTGRLISLTTAEKLQEMMQSCVERKYGTDYFPDVIVCAKSGTAEKDGDTRSDALFTGFIDDPDYPLAFIVVVQEGGYGSSTCAPIIGSVLQVCMDVLDES